jgi:capsular polysaccharide export protein
MLRSVYATSAPCYLFPLQLATDYQIRANSGFPDQFAAIALTIRSFAAYAPAESLLLFKAHPLDNGLMRWERFIRRTASEGGVATRVHYLVGGKLNRLIDRCRGMVTINSTAGTTALQRAIPVIALGSAIFDIPGLTFQHGIDRFWSEAAPPDPAFVADFIRALAGSIQVKGGFYSHDAVQAGAEACAERLHLDLVNEPLAFEAQPPRMVALAARAQAQRLPARPHSAQRPRRRAIG